MGTVAHVQEAAYAASKTDARNTISSDTLLREAINGDQTLMSDVKKVITAYNGLNVDHAEMETLTFGDFLKLYAYGATQDNLLSKTEKEKMVDLANHLLSLEQAKEQLENAISLGRSNSLAMLPDGFDHGLRNELNRADSILQNSKDIAEIINETQRILEIIGAVLSDPANSDKDLSDVTGDISKGVNGDSSASDSAAANSDAVAQSSIASSVAAEEAKQGQHYATSVASDAAANSDAVAQSSIASSVVAEEAKQGQHYATSVASDAASDSDAVAQSSIASSVVAEEAKQGQHYATLVASDAATNNQNVADFNNQKSAAVAEANNEANSQHVANDQNVVNAINNIKNAAAAASLTDAADKAAIAIANAASRNVAASRVVNTNVASNTAISGVNGGVVNAGNQASANVVAGTPTPVANTTAGAVAPIANATVATASVNNGPATQAANADNGRHPKKAAIHDRKVVAEGSKSLHDTQMTNKHTGLLTSLISALVAAVLALFFLFFWKRRKQQEEENVAANADEALLKDVQNTKDSWK